VSSHSPDIAACKEFLNVLLSEDIQQTINFNIPVNKNCARESALKDIQSNNERVQKSSGVKYTNPGALIDPSAADRYIEQLSTATTSGFVYHSISLIIYEEIPAYFEGQKSFEDVAKVINDRAQKVLDERG
jgi:ABC-type glycerol-3-phosphate transport system substrate-binding protein